jgi:hypothetical protein
LKLRVAVFGVEVFDVEVTPHDPAQMLADLIAELSSRNDDGETPRTPFPHLGCHIERSPETDDWGDDKSEGFGFCAE